MKPSKSTNCRFHNIHFLVNYELFTLFIKHSFQIEPYKIQIFMRNFVLLLGLLINSRASAQSLCFNFFQSQYPLTFQIPKPQKVQQLRQDLSSAGFKHVDSVEYLGKGAQGFVIRVIFDKQTGRSPLVIKKFLVGEKNEAQNHQDFFAIYSQIPKEERKDSFLPIHIYKDSPFKNTLIQENIYGRDLGQLLNDPEISIQLKSTLILLYHHKLKSTIELFQKHFSGVHVQNPVFENRDLTQLNFTYQSIPGNPRVSSKQLDLSYGDKKYFVILKPDNILVDPYLNMYLIDKN